MTDIARLEAENVELRAALDALATHPDASVTAEDPDESTVYDLCFSAEDIRRARRALGLPENTHTWDAAYRQRVPLGEKATVWDAAKRQRVPVDELEAAGDYAS